MEYFASTYGASFNPGFHVGHSPISQKVKCLGGFVDRSKLDLSSSQDNMIELLRIPRSSTFSINNLGKLDDEYDSRKDEQLVKTISKVRELFFACCESDTIRMHVSETLMLIVYFVIFRGLEQSGYRLPAVISHYLNEVLLKTEVGSLYSDICMWRGNQDIPTFAQYGLTGLSEVFTTLSEFSGATFEIDGHEAIVSKIMASIHSRCLEIPYSAQDGSDDFYVSSTLVPILDYINHNNDLMNAHFDIDRKTSDVILLLDLDKCPSTQDVFEVFISYSEPDEVIHFEKYYGFSCPLSTSSLNFMNLCFDKRFLEFDGLNLAFFYKWFSIKPSLQLIWRDGQVYVNDTRKEFAELILPFVSNSVTPDKSCFFYNAACYETFAKFFARARQCSKEEVLEESKKLVASRENSPSESTNLPQLAWTCHYGADADSYARLNKEQCMQVLFETDSVYTGACERWEKFLRFYMISRVQMLKEVGEQLSPSSKTLAHHENTAMRQLLNRLEKGLSIYWSDSEYYMALELPECELPALLQNSAHTYKSQIRAQSPNPEIPLTCHLEEEYNEYCGFFESSF